ncbi:hypothetical protein GN244_ATG15755 [Phytophthora infestans]|uniref:Uncharacterized protein n=1 Tax=Phytophthora infestans TaxID=4787 RepID=A0A833T214_PHYIN|nr:hypothetical protein GN244_ATG15755 [Phytophthora infestans]KAF4150047.1 hypothetical protein GN958_ATG00673 [Phytophthora infestans]
MSTKVRYDAGDGNVAFGLPVATWKNFLKLVLSVVKWAMPSYIGHGIRKKRVSSTLLLSASERQMLLDALAVPHGYRSVSGQ